MTAQYSNVVTRKIIYIYGNGDPTKTTKILLCGRLAENDSEIFDRILNLISDRVGKTLAGTRTGGATAARRLFDLQVVFGHIFKCKICTVTATTIRVIVFLLL